MSDLAGNEPAPPELKDLRWDQDQLEFSLDRIYQFAKYQAESAMAWYRRSKRSKRIWARVLRVVAIIATALAGIIPVLSQIFADETGQPAWPVNPAWASVAVAVGVTALGLDRFFGFSSAWIRFMTTELKVDERLKAFQFEWETERLSWQGRPPTYEQCRDGIVRCATFTNEVSRMVQEETQVWVEEFQAVLKKLDESLKTQSQVGAIVVTVENGDQCQAGWTLSIPGKGQQIHRGQTGVVSQVYPGLYKLTAEGEIDAVIRKAEGITKVASGEIVNVSLKLT